MGMHKQPTKDGLGGFQSSVGINSGETKQTLPLCDTDIRIKQQVTKLRPKLQTSNK